MNESEEKANNVSTDQSETLKAHSKQQCLLFFAPLYTKQNGDKRDVYI